MRNLLNTFVCAAVVVFAMTITAGCTLEKEESLSLESKKDVMVLLDLTVRPMQTKAIDDQALKTVRIYAFDNTGALIGHTYTEEMSEVHVILSVSESQPTLDVEFLVVANEQAMYYDNSHITLSENMTRTDLKNIFYNSLYVPAKTLPLYGIHHQTLNLNVGSAHTESGHTGFLLNDEVSIALERSLAKVGVYAAAVEGTSVDPIINKVTLLSAGRRDGSYLFPATDQTALEARDDNVDSYLNDRVFDLSEDGIDVLSNSGVVTKRLATSNLASNIAVTDYYTEIMSPIYLAEVPYGSESWNVEASQEDRPVILVIEYSFGSGTIVKKVDVNMPKIERNNFYQIRCLIKADGQIMVDVMVLPWEEGEDHQLDFDFPTHSDPLMATSSLQPDGTYATHTYGTPATMYYYAADPEKGAFSVDFNMSYPIGGKWNPSVTGTSGTDYTLKVYKRGSTTSESDNMVVVTDGPLAEQWYTIKVIPTLPENVGKKFSLSVTYTPIYGGAAYSYLLQINGGEESNLAWSDYSPIDDDAYSPSTVNIVITQIEEQTGF